MPRKDEPRAKLGWVLDGEFRYDPHAGPNRLAADALVDALSEYVVGTSEVLAASVQMLAEAVDSDPTNAALWGQYRAAVDQLRGLGATDDDDAFSKLMEQLGSGTDVRDPAQSEPSNARRSDRQGGRRSRAAVDAPPATDR